MKKMFLLFSHTLTQKQKEDAQKNLNVDLFVELPQDLQDMWSNVPPDLYDLDSYLISLKYYVRSNAKEGDIFLIQGEFGACCEMVKFVKKLGFTAVYSTTKRESIEKKVDGKIVKTSRFEHVIFRKY